LPLPKYLSLFRKKELLRLVQVQGHANIPTPAPKASKYRSMASALLMATVVTTVPHVKVILIVITIVEVTISVEDLDLLVILLTPSVTTKPTLRAPLDINAAPTERLELVQALLQVVQPRKDMTELEAENSGELLTVALLKENNFALSVTAWNVSMSIRISKCVEDVKEVKAAQIVPPSPELSKLNALKAHV